MVIDKLRERLLGLVFVADDAISGAAPSLEDIVAKKIKGRLYDAYRQSWVASPESAYVAAGNGPLQAPLSELQSIIDAPQQKLDVKGRAVPAPSSGLVAAERAVMQSRGLLNSQGKITPWVLTADTVNTPEKLLTRERWNSIYAVPRGEVTV